MSTQTQSQSAPAASLPQTTPQNATTWKIDSSHSVAHFTVRHMMVTNVRGQFSGVTGSVSLTPDLKLSSVTATIDVSTVDTREAGAVPPVNKSATVRRASGYLAEAG